MNYSDLLVSTAKKRKSIVCLGLDPILDKIPIQENNLRKKIFIFFETILNEIVRKNIYPSAVKPNYAFYAQYGFEGLYALQDVISLFQKAGLIVILDAKRGDIGSTSLAYAKECFGFFNADAVTLAPYMGYDSISPFLKFDQDKGIYVLCRTSNNSAVDFQDLVTDGSPLYIKVAEKLCAWGSGNLGAVIGATYPHELEEILLTFSKLNKKVPLLIPGIGSQGGDLKSIVGLLKKYSYLPLHRINSSSGILYAYEKVHNVQYNIAAINELNKLNEEIEILSEGLC
jgi:orotidine-5'-phosphate decarboxylase